MPRFAIEMKRGSSAEICTEQVFDEAMRDASVARGEGIACFFRKRVGKAAAILCGQISASVLPGVQRTHRAAISIQI